MRWQAPSERVQFVLLSPIVVPAALLLAIGILPAVPLILLGDWWRKRQMARGRHRWFAWRPVKFDGFFHDLPDQWLWLETIERERDGCGWHYRPLGMEAQ